MKIRVSTTEEISKVIFRFGEATIIGSGASMFVSSVSRLQSLFGGIIGLALILIGILLHTNADLKGR